jgi:hypothetical protein
MQCELFRRNLIPTPAEVWNIWCWPPVTLITVGATTSTFIYLIATWAHTAARSSATVSTTMLGTMCQIYNMRTNPPGTWSQPAGWWTRRWNAHCPVNQWVFNPTLGTYTPTVGARQALTTLVYVFAEMTRSSKRFENLNRCRTMETYSSRTTTYLSSLTWYVLNLMELGQYQNQRE